MKETKETFDIISFVLIILSIVFLYVGNQQFVQYNGYNPALADMVANFLRLVNPAEGYEQVEMRKSNFYISEERSVFGLFIVSTILSVISSIKLIVGKMKGNTTSVFPGLVLVSLTLIFSSVFMVFDIGLYHVIFTKPFA
ncbi:hypothetical protein A9Q99_05785 [Gammaproteobacteria bacterium 45_16_T64]|nr:hypothetical protein A9Q99_05785 [Gammaproteobacteria bacterium 45_16_T64]